MKYRSVSYCKGHNEPQIFEILSIHCTYKGLLLLTFPFYTNLLLNITVKRKQELVITGSQNLFSACITINSITHSISASSFTEISSRWTYKNEWSIVYLSHYYYYQCFNFPIFFSANWAVISQSLTDVVSLVDICIHTSTMPKL